MVVYKNNLYCLELLTDSAKTGEYCLEREDSSCGVFCSSGMKKETRQVCEALEVFSWLNGGGTEGSEARL